MNFLLLRSFSSPSLLRSTTFGCLATPTRADDYPNRPVRIMVGFIPGAAADITARVLGNGLGKLLGQQFVIENKSGAGSSLAARIFGAGAEGRLHAVARHVGQRHQPGAHPQPRLRHDEGFRADRARLRGAGDPGRASLDRRQERQGADRARQGQARRPALCLDRRRAPRRNARGRVVRHPCRRQDGAHTLSGEPAGRDRPDRRPHRRDLLARPDCDRAGRGRQAHGARDRGCHAGERGARPAHHGGSRHAGFRHQHLVRPDGAGRLAAGDRRQARPHGAGGDEGRARRRRRSGARASISSPAGPTCSRASSSPRPPNGTKPPRRPA